MSARPVFTRPPSAAGKQMPWPVVAIERVRRAVLEPRRAAVRVRRARRSAIGGAEEAVADLDEDVDAAVVPERHRMGTGSRATGDQMRLARAPRSRPSRPGRRFRAPTGRRRRAPRPPIPSSRSRPAARCSPGRRACRCWRCPRTRGRRPRRRGSRPAATRFAAWVSAPITDIRRPARWTVSSDQSSETTVPADDARRGQRRGGRAQRGRWGRAVKPASTSAALRSLRTRAISRVVGAARRRR